MAPKCCYNIPFFGGFCAPTENPEPSPLRHVSNEYTLPPPPNARQNMPTSQ